MYELYYNFFLYFTRILPSKIYSLNSLVQGNIKYNLPNINRMTSMNFFCGWKILHEIDNIHYLIHRDLTKSLPVLITLVTKIENFFEHDKIYVIIKLCIHKKTLINKKIVNVWDGLDNILFVYVEFLMFANLFLLLMIKLHLNFKVTFYLEKILRHFLCGISLRLYYTCYMYRVLILKIITVMKEFITKLSLINTLIKYTIN